MFQVGQHVLCVDDDGFSYHCGETVPRKGHVYTVRGLMPETPPAVLLEEIVNKPQRYLEGVREAAFYARRFRPLSSDRLSIFRQHLAPSPTDKVDA